MKGFVDQEYLTSGRNIVKPLAMILAEVSDHMCFLCFYSLGLAIQ